MKQDLGLQCQTPLSDSKFFGGGCSSSCSCCCSCDRGKTKSTPSLKTMTGVWQKHKEIRNQIKFKWKTTKSHQINQANTAKPCLLSNRNNWLLNLSNTVYKVQVKGFESLLHRFVNLILERGISVICRGRVIRTDCKLQIAHCSD